MQAVCYFVLIPMVYAALAVFIVGTAVQGARIIFGLKRSLGTAVGPEKRPKTLGAFCEALLPWKVWRDRPFHAGILTVFHVACLLLVLGHVELIGEVGIFQIIQHDVPPGRGWIGILLFAALAFFLLRRFHSPARDISEPEDYYILLLLLLAVLFGNQLHLARAWFDYSTVGVDEYREYLSGIFTFQPMLPEAFEDDYVGHSFLLVLHVFFANLLLMWFPFSNMLHALLAFPLARLARR